LINPLRCSHDAPPRGSVALRSLIVVGCASEAFGKVRERQRKARREAFLRNQQYLDHARGECAIPRAILPSRSD
jgi:hypothetical protein